MTKEYDSNKILIIEVIRFILSLIVAFGHFNGVSNTSKNYFLHAAFAVDCFFVISGLLMCRNAIERKNCTEIVENRSNADNTWGYLRRKIVKIYPPFIVAWLMTFVKAHVLNKSSLKVVVTSLFNSVPELLFLGETGIQGNYYLGVAWYVSAMLLTMCVTYPMVSRYKEQYAKLWSFITSVYLYGMINHSYAKLAGNLHDWCGVGYKSLFRSFIDINMGIFLGGWIPEFGRIKWTRSAKMIIGFFEYLCYILLVVYMIAPIDGNFEILMMTALSMALLISFSRISFIDMTLQRANRAICFLGRSSTYIYFGHWVLVSNENAWDMSMKSITTYIVGVVLTSSVVFILSKFLIRCVESSKKFWFE